MRRCTTVPGYGTCCRALSQGIAQGQAFSFTGPSGRQVCGKCTIAQSQSKNPMKRGKQVFHFSLAAHNLCGIGPSACPALTQGTGGTLQLPAPGGGTTAPVLH